MRRASKLEVKRNDLRWRCNPNHFGFESTDDIPCHKQIFGQERALGAIELGLEIQSPGYNLYISGLTGTGKSTTVKHLLESMQHAEKDLFDICYVHNFGTPDMPVAMYLPVGKGSELRRSMRGVLRTLREYIPKTLESDAFTKRQKAIAEDFKQKRGEIVTQLESEISERGFKLLEVQYGPFTRPVILPVVGDQPVEVEKLSALANDGKIDKAEVERIKKDHADLVEKMEALLKISREMDRELADKMSALTTEFISPIVETSIHEVVERFPEDKVHGYLGEVREFCVNNFDVFIENEGKPEKHERSDDFTQFEVNVIVDNSRTTNVPVIVETSPSYSNLFGTIERVTDGRGEYRTDLTMIRSGSFLRANGGFLVLSLSDLLEEAAVWPTLKRALKNKKVTIQGLDSWMLIPTSGLKPQPIDVDVKVVLIGDVESYQVLYHYDEDFRKIFKVKADFDTEMPNTDENLRKYAQFIRNIIDDEKLPAFHKTAVAAVAEEGSRIAGRQDRLTTRFSDVADLIREAAYWARKDRAKLVKARHVDRAVAGRIHRANLPEEKISEMLVSGTILLDIDGEKIGQVNGLSVYDLGDYAFGKPVRITVETSMGRAGIINIEREAEMSGKTYNKGSLILEGYLRRRFAQDKPLAMSASICFEQSYGGVDGDSASSTEIYGLLSSLADLPIRQDLAVTGSVNQKGEIQPIGAVNEKIHGFYDICKAKGLTGRQGVIIPSLNKKDLMLRPDVVSAIAKRQFHVYSIDTIDEGIELLTGVKAGRQLAEGGFEKNSVNCRVDEKLERFAEQIKDFFEGEDDKDGAKD